MRRLSKTWAFINSYEESVSPLYLYNNEATLWMDTKTGDYTFALKQFNFPFYKSRSKIEEGKKVLTLKQLKTKHDGSIATKITRRGDFEVKVDTQLLSGRNNNQIIVHTRRVEIKIDNLVVFLTHCKDQREINIPNQLLENYDFAGEMFKGKSTRVYRIRKKYEKGKMNVVKVVCRDKERGAVSTTRKRNSASRTLQHEIDVLKPLSHSNVIKFISAGEEPLSRHLVTEYGGGGDLSFYMLRNKHRSEATGRIIFKQVLSAILYLHENHVVHRDIKPANIVFMSLNSIQSVKIIDFDVSQRMPASGEMSSGVGTIEYMSPVVLNNYVFQAKVPYTEKTDIWSFAVTLYYFFAHKFPFAHSKSPKRYLKAMMENSPKMERQEIAKLSGSAKQVLLACLKVKEKDRPSADALRSNYPWFH